MKVLIPGGSGYVGAALVPHLLQAGHQVTVYDTAPSEIVGQKFIKGDVTGRAEFAGACEGQDAVIYLASISNNDRCVAEPQLAKEVNIEAMLDVPRIAKACNVKRFIYASSVAGYRSADKPAKESEPILATTPYARGKVWGEQLTRGEGAGWTIVRSASVCGFSPRMRYDTPVNKMVHDALTYGRIKVNGGQQKRSHIHMLDLCDFYRLLLDLPQERSAGEVFNVVAENHSVLETAEIVIRSLAPNVRRARNMPAFIEVGDATDERSYMVDGTKAREFLGFIPKRTVAGAVREISERFHVSHAA